MGEESEQIRLALDKYGGREQRRQREAADRQELLELAEVGRRAKSQMDEEEALMGSTQRANQQLSEIYEAGASILSTMAGSRERLKVRRAPAGRQTTQRRRPAGPQVRASRTRP